MDSPFPGMDPYLEAHYLWPDFHARLSFAISDQLQPFLSPRYIAALTPHVALESLAIALTRHIVPDIGVLDRDMPGTMRGGGTAIAAAPLTGTVERAVTTRYHRVEIRARGDEALVTAIEILSPVNKRPGADAAETYERKRREIFDSTTHLLEIDLLRAGRRPALIEPLPDAPYFIFLSRIERRPTIEIWPLMLQQPIPIVPVPLLAPDPDVPLDLTAALARIYQSARYDLSVDYRQPPPLPALTAAEADWADERLRVRGLRP